MNNSNKKVIKVKLSNKDKFGYMVMADIRLRKTQPIKNVEIILQDIIEKAFGGVWWQHTNRNIFEDLIQYHNDLQYYIFGVLIPSLY